MTKGVIMQNVEKVNRALVLKKYIQCKYRTKSLDTAPTA